MEDVCARMELHPGSGHKECKGASVRQNRSQCPDITYLEEVTTDEASLNTKFVFLQIV